MVRNIVFLGKVGHGKTRLLNALTNATFPSSAAASSCTRCLQLGRIPESDITIVDTPGFYSSEEVEEHISAQIEAFDLPICGVYIIVRFGAPADMAEVANRMMDFTGQDDIRVICTHVDTVERETWFNGNQVAAELSCLLDIPKENIALVGNRTSVRVIQHFIVGTLHSPRRIKVAKEQRAVVASLAVGSRKFNREIGELAGILDAMERMSNGRTKSYASFLLVEKAQEYFLVACRDIETRARDLLPRDEQNVLSQLAEVEKTCLASFQEKHKPSRSDEDGTRFHGHRAFGCRRNMSSHRGYCSGQRASSSWLGKWGHGSCRYGGRKGNDEQNSATKNLEASLYTCILSHFEDKSTEGQKPIPNGSRFSRASDPSSLGSARPAYLNAPPLGVLGCEGRHNRDGLGDIGGSPSDVAPAAAQSSRPMTVSCFFASMLRPKLEGYCSRQWQGIASPSLMAQVSPAFTTCESGPSLLPMCQWHSVAAQSSGRQHNNCVIRALRAHDLCWQTTATAPNAPLPLYLSYVNWEICCQVCGLK